MKHLLTLLLLFTSTFLSADSHSMEIESLLSKLDSLIARKDDFVAAKEAKINQLHNQGRNIRTSEERYWLNKMYYDEYSVYNSDSAMIYVDQNLDIADKLNKKEWKAEWKIKKSFLLAATGLLKEALDELRNVSSQLLTPELKVEYYGQLMYLYSHFRQYSGDNNTNIREGYYEKEKAYKDSIYAYITPQDPFYLWYKGWKFLGTTETESIKKELLNEVERSSLETRRDAMNAYILACLYQDSNQQNEYLKYMIYSAMADVKTANKDIASLEELSKTLYELNDIDRAYTYINYCLQNAQLYRNRVRVIGISETQDAIHRAYQERNIRQEARLHTFLFLVSILSIILLIAILYIYMQMKRLAYSRSQLNESNQLLNKHVDELSETHQLLEKANGQLQSLNEQLKETNAQLRESNYVKEEYIGYVFSICSNYISKLDEFRKSINRKMKAKQFDDIKELTDSPIMAQNELKELYHNFDAIFLHVYPNFVEDFNALLHPDEQILLKDGELLNTELRIYALVRLGINDSVKIAEFLHCSPQTVYNNRLKTRNKAIVPKDEFANTVKNLGKMQE
ncbi:MULTISPECIES: DUF6377 domain-containing protein [Bacteroides]|uniref:DUF6377 domain-containing protein n=1 Tax=Bacteroides TaxID=816 RepID=UPI00319E7F87